MFKKQNVGLEYAPLMLAYPVLPKEKKSSWSLFIEGVNVLLVPTFWGHFYFGLYIFILPFLVLKMKNTFYFGLYGHLTNENY